MAEWNFVDMVLTKMRMNQILKHITSDAILVDIGCGYHTQLLKNLKHKIKHGQGLDIQVKNSNKENITLHKIDLLNDKYPFRNNSIDVVTMLAVIEHFDNPDYILSEIHRILKNGGKLLLTTPTPPSKPILEFCAHSGIFRNKDALDHKIYYSKSRLIHRLMEYGFDDINHHYFQLGFNQIVVAKKSL